MSYESFKENISSIGTEDRMSKSGVKGYVCVCSDLMKDIMKLREENLELQNTLRSIRENTEHDTNNLITSVIAWKNDQFEKEFAEFIQWKSEQGSSFRTHEHSQFVSVPPDDEDEPSITSSTANVSRTSIARYTLPVACPACGTDVTAPLSPEGQRVSHSGTTLKHVSRSQRSSKSNQVPLEITDSAAFVPTAASTPVKGYSHFTHNSSAQGRSHISSPAITNSSSSKPSVNFEQETSASSRRSSLSPSLNHDHNSTNVSAGSRRSSHSSSRNHDHNNSPRTSERSLTTSRSPSRNHDYNSPRTSERSLTSSHSPSRNNDYNSPRTSDRSLTSSRSPSRNHDYNSPSTSERSLTSSHSPSRNHEHNSTKTFEKSRRSSHSSSPRKALFQSGVSNHEQLTDEMSRLSSHKQFTPQIASQSPGSRSTSVYNADKTEQIADAESVPQSYRRLGEIAFQLERRILDFVFTGKKTDQIVHHHPRRFYGYTVSNIPSMIPKEAEDADGYYNPKREAQIRRRLARVLSDLAPLGYDMEEHGLFSQKIINKYGLLGNIPNKTSVDAFGMNDEDTLLQLVSRVKCSEEERSNVHILLECLLLMARQDGRPILLW